MRAFDTTSLRWKYKDVPGFDFEYAQLKDGSYLLKKWNHPKGVQAPTEDELLAIQKEYEDYVASIEYMNKRRMAYPPIVDQLDAIWKILKALQSGVDPPKDAINVQSEIESVKEKYPEP